MELSSSGHQLHRIFALIGTPSDEQIEALSSPAMRRAIAQLQARARCILPPPLFILWATNTEMQSMS